MNRFLVRLQLSALAASAAVSAADTFSPPYAGDRILIQPKAGVTAQALAPLQAADQSKVLRTFKRLGGLQVVSVPAGQTVERLIARYQQSGLVEYAEPDYIYHLDLTPNDPAYTNGTTWGPNKIEAPAAWDVRASAGNIVIAVLDSGVRYTHEDLASNMWANATDGSHGWNALAWNTDPNDDSGSAHGTQMAGVLGAVGNNGKGLAGVAWRVQIMACKCFNSQDSGTNSDIITCIEFAREHGARIINASWSGPSPSCSLSNAIYDARSAGIILVTSAGNAYPTVNVDNTPWYPAAYNLDNILTVAYTGSSDSLGFLSNYGATNVDLAAPGEQIYSTYNSSDTAYFGFYSGTSFAAAYVSGALALLLAQYPADSYQQIIARLLNATDPVPALTGKCRTGGRLNLRKALPPIRLTATLAGAGGPFQLQVAAISNLSCIIQVSTNFMSWTPIFTNITSAAGTFDFADYAPTNLAQRYYRAMASP